MDLHEVVREFAHDKQLHAVAVLIALDLVLGIIASIKLGQFAFTKVSAFLKDDVLSKVLPWFAIFAAAKFAPSVDVAGVDLNQIQTVVWGIMVVALVASLTSSLADLSIKVENGLPKALATGENEGATPKPSG